MRGRVGLVGALVLAVAGCGSSAPTVRIDDPRLPVDARRWVADAEDGVLVARAWRDRARDDAAQAVAFGDHERAQAAALRAAGGGDAAARLEDVALRREGLAGASLDAAAAELGLAKARERLVHAETAVRYDVAVVELEPLRRAVGAALEQARQLRRRAEESRQALEEATTAWWRTYGAWVAASGQRSLLWTGGRGRTP